MLGLLAVLTFAAEQMQYDVEFNGNAYYPRLYRLLKVPDEEKSRVKSGYRKHAEELWNGLNEWMLTPDGRLGLPTAYAVTSRFVGLPLSQALVRSADRGQFPLMFHKFGLSAGGEISPADMETLLDGWIAQRPCPISRSLESLWQRGDARERIASVAAIELRNWDGSAAGAVSEGIRSSGSVRIQCWVRRFPRPQLEVSFAASFGGQSADTTATVLSAPQKPSLDLVPIPDGRVQPLASSKSAADLLIDGILRLANPAGVIVSRYPRRVIPLRHDELLNTFVEAERLQLGEGRRRHCLSGQSTTPSHRHSCFAPCASTA